MGNDTKVLIFLSQKDHAAKIKEVVARGDASGWFEPDAKVKVGDKVRALFVPNGTWHPAVVVKVHRLERKVGASDYVYKVEFNDPKLNSEDLCSWSADNPTWKHPSEMQPLLR